MDSRAVTCPDCQVEVEVPIEEMVLQCYRMSGPDREVTLLSVPPTLQRHVRENHDQPV